MTTTIYLDQNTLSDIRERKLKENKNSSLQLLRQILMQPDISVVYSHIHLAEITQITLEKYQLEHIELLEILNAKFIEPSNKQLSTMKPHQIWQNHLENELQNEELGINEVIKFSDLSHRKLSGLPIEESFEEIGNEARRSLKKLLDHCTKQLENIDLEELEEPLRSHFTTMKDQLPELIANCQNMETLAIPEDQMLGPIPFRECYKDLKLELSTLPIDKVVSSIEKIFENKNSEFDWKNYFEDTSESRISRAYSLMNWAGYYEDDFVKIKKRGDRFRASSNDMQHAAMAFGSHFLISNDEAFRMKAIACYEYVASKTLVCSPNNFLRNHCKIA